MEVVAPFGGSCFGVEVLDDGRPGRLSHRRFDQQSQVIHPDRTTLPAEHIKVQSDDVRRVKRVNAAFAYPLGFGQVVPGQRDRRPLLAGRWQLNVEGRYTPGIRIGLRGVFYTHAHDHRQARLVGPPGEAQAPGVLPLAEVNAYATTSVTIRADFKGQPHGLGAVVTGLVRRAGEGCRSLADIGPPAGLEIAAFKVVNDRACSQRGQAARWGCLLWRLGGCLRRLGGRLRWLSGCLWRLCGCRRHRRGRNYDDLWRSLFPAKLAGQQACQQKQHNSYGDPSL